MHDMKNQEDMIAEKRIKSIKDHYAYIDSDINRFLFVPLPLFKNSREKEEIYACKTI
jgi:hypothetical protein